MNTFSKLICLPGLLAFASCGSARPYAALSIEGDAELVSNVVVSNDDLYDAIRIGRPGVQRLPTSDQLKVMVPIRNISDSTLQVRVQTSFLDLERQPIGDETNQQVQILSPGATVTHTAISSSTAARDWTMRIFPNSR